VDSGPTTLQWASSSSRIRSVVASAYGVFKDALHGQGKPVFESCEATGIEIDSSVERLVVFSPVVLQPVGQTVSIPVQ
jgi:hypothetical protein